MNTSLPRRPRRRRLLRTVPTAVLAAVLLAGCGAGTSSTQDAAAPESRAEGVAAGPEAASDARGAADGDAAVAERSVVHTASMRVHVTDLDAAAEDAKRWVRDADGYVAAESASDAGGDNPHVRLTLRVPVDRYDDALTEFAALGDRRSLERRVEDVTEAVADVDSRVASAQASLDRLRDLLDEAETVDEVLRIEEQLSTRQADLESLQARQDALAETTTYGTVELSLALPSSAVPPADRDSPGFLGGLAAGWRALTAVVDVVVVAVGWLLPFVAVLTAVGLPLLWLRRRRRARREAVDGPVRDTAGAAGSTDDGAPARDGAPKDGAD